jgi:hypothetical protein
LREIVLHHHLGLGDHFVCNGIVNFLCNYFDSIYLACKKNNYNTVSLLYSENNKIKIFEVVDEFNDVLTFSKSKKIPILRVGFENCNVKEWNTSFYSQLGIKFCNRYDLFKLPTKIPKEDEVFDLFYKGEDYCLIHQESSIGKYDLKINSNLNKIQIEKSTDPFGNILNYTKLINKASEIHCINSSLFHFVDSLPLKCRLVYHDVRKIDFKIDENKWEVVNYD